MDDVVVYMLTRYDGMRYIGVTVSLKKRIKAHLKTERFSAGISDIKKLFETDDYSLALEMETFFIKFYDTFNKGLNKSINGKGNHLSQKFTTKGFKYSEESKKKMSESGKKRIQRDGPVFVGKTHSKESKDKMSLFRKGKYNRKRVFTNEIAINILNNFESKSEDFTDEFIINFLKKTDVENFINGIDYTKLKQKNGKFLTYKTLFVHKVSSEYNVHPNAIREILKYGKNYAKTIDY